MPTCIVCLNALKDPAALPCGHVFCYDCLIRLIRSITPYTTNHFCPTCKQAYTISNVDPNLVPHHLRSFITPSVRKLFLEYTIPSPGKATTSSNSECEHLRAENASLKTCCFVWRKRAAVHAAATLGLVGLARLARDYGLRMKKERDEFEEKYNQLKKEVEEKTMVPETPPETPSSCPPSPRDAELRAHSSPLPHLPHIDELELGLEPLEANIPPSLSRSTSSGSESEHRPLSPALYRSPSPAMSDESYCSECPDCMERKRKRSSEELDDDEPEPERPIKRSHSSSPKILAPTPLSPGQTIASYLEGTLTI
ncbi:hypothetical protein L226DRAFT_465555 [Lentinus tigrinus ALCF2SS1-7]|uniref:RING-type domain-containing protein n=1 Tax=Lentinus tigrinus ALCF2SS1-6 TaxID=1328759 RepID=A0A5C2S5B8_9APHY|nr:hypothetical protein L227DRAFT_576585 [Lentinus tigrinus ALCF2SS1-6]RPD73374.1 hypothetical protein L226DRAFT_465555 [Lentinus tigrinus ALCF2SS1-7]